MYRPACDWRTAEDHTIQRMHGSGGVSHLLGHARPLPDPVRVRRTYHVPLCDRAKTVVARKRLATEIVFNAGVSTEGADPGGLSNREQ